MKGARGSALARARSALAVRAHADAAGWAWHGPAALGGGQAPAWCARMCVRSIMPPRAASDASACERRCERDNVQAGQHQSVTVSNRKGAFKFTLVRQEPYTRKDGQASAINVWQGHCVRCGAAFEVTTSAKVVEPSNKVRSFQSRRCPSCTGRSRYSRNALSRTGSA